MEQRVGGLAGILFSALSLAVLPLCAWPLPPPSPPTLGDAPEAFAAWYAAHRLGFLVGNYLGLVAFVPGFVQLAALVARIRRKDAPDGTLAALVLATGTFTYAVFACSLAAFQALPFLADGGAPERAAGMWTLSSVWFSLDGLAALPFVLAVGWAGRATGALPPGFAGFSLAVAIAALAMSFGGLVSEPAWLAGGGALTMGGFVAFFAWTSALAVVSLVRPTEGRATQAR